MNKYSSPKVTNICAEFVRHFQRLNLFFKFRRVTLALLVSPYARMLVAVGDEKPDVETQKRAAQSALRRTRICGDAERLDFSSDFSAHLAIDGFDVHLVIRFGFYHLARTRQRVFTGEPSSGDVLLRALSGG